MRAVGRPDLDQLRPGALHDVRNSERTPDFDQFAARNNHLLARSKCVEQEKHCSRVVVDDGCSFSARQFAEQLFDDLIAVAAAALAQVVFQGAWLGGSPRHGFDRFTRHDRASQIRVEHGSRQINHLTQIGSRASSQFRLRHIEQRIIIRRFRQPH